MFLSFFFPFTLSFLLPPTFPLPPNFQFFLSFKLSLQQVCADAGLRPRRPADVAPARGRCASVHADPWTRMHPRPRLYYPRLHPSFLLFPSFAFGWSCGIYLATPILTCKGRRNHKHFEGDPLAFFAKKKFKGCIYLLDACVFSYVSVYVKIFKRRHRRNRRSFLGICRCHGFFRGWCARCGPFELY
jgi:hypothetical protein